jgi:hypothetical protein
MCSPSGRPDSSYGDGHAAKGPRSSAHSKVESLTVEEKRNRAVPPLISATGPESMVVSGASTTVKAQRAGVGSTLTLWSFGSRRTERTRNRWSPSSRPEYRAGDSHSSKACPSMAHSKVARLSLAVKAKGTVASPPASGSRPAVTSGGPWVIVVSRPVVSMTVHSHVETGASSTAFWSRTATSNVWGPSGRPL